MAANLLNILLAQDGSTTRLCEAVAGKPVGLQVHAQRLVAAVPETVQLVLGGQSWIERITSLHLAGQVLMDNLTWTRMDRLPADFQHGLEQGILPVGRLLERLFVQRKMVELSNFSESLGIPETLFNTVGLPDAHASRCYTINTETGPFMLVFETYRAALSQAFTRSVL